MRKLLLALSIIFLLALFLFFKYFPTSNSLTTFAVKGPTNTNNVDMNTIEEKEKLTTDEISSKNLEIVFNLVMLRNAIIKKNLSEIASLIVELDPILTSHKMNTVKDKWSLIKVCSYSKCDDNLFLDIIYELVRDDPSKEGQAIEAIVIVNKLWYGKEPYEFSLAVKTLEGNYGSNKVWQEIKNCDRNCSNLNDLTFNFILSLS